MKDTKSKIYLFVAAGSFLVFLLFVAYLLSGTPRDASVSVSDIDVALTGTYFETNNYDSGEQVVYTNIVDIPSGSVDLTIKDSVHIVANAPFVLSANQASSLEIQSGTAYIETQKLTAIKVGSSTAFFLEPNSSAIVDSELRSIIVLSGFGSYRSDNPIIKGEAARWEVDQFNTIDFDRNIFIDNPDVYNTFHLLYRLKKLPVEYRYVIDSKQLGMISEE